MRLPRLLTPSLALALAFGGVTVAQSDERPLDRIQGATKNIQAQLKNASMRLKYTVKGSPTGGLRSDALEAGVTNPMRECCSRNLEVIYDRMETIALSVRELYNRHAAAEDPWNTSLLWCNTLICSDSRLSSSLENPCR